MSKPRVVQASGIAYPSAALRQQLSILHGPGTVHRLDKLMEDVDAIDALAGILKESIDARNVNGNLDLRDVAADVIARLRANPKV